LHNVDLTERENSLNRNIESSRRFFFRKKPSSFCNQTKTDHSENELLTTVILSPLNILKLHEPD